MAVSDSYGWFLAGFQLQWNNIFGMNQTPENIFDVIFRISINGTNCPLKYFLMKTFTQNILHQNKHSFKTGFDIYSCTFMESNWNPKLNSVLKALNY
jgi:hypothetical protein